MKHDVVIDSNTDAFILADSGTVAGYNERLAECVNIMLDPEGETCATLHYEGKSWPDVVRNARGLAQSLVEDRFVLIHAASGYTYLTLQDEPISSNLKPLVYHIENLHLNLPSGSITVGDGMFLFDEESSRELEPAEDFLLPAGRYDIKVHVLKPDPELAPALRVFGDDEVPAVVVQLTKVDAHEEKPIEARLDTSHWQLDPAPNVAAIAIVEKVIGDIAHAKLRESRNFAAGHARFTIPEGASVAVDDDRWVLLERDAGKYWTASLIEE